MYYCKFLYYIQCYLGYSYLDFTDAEKRYVISWSTPHCVLTLKLIGLQWDLYDGAQEVSSITCCSGLLPIQLPFLWRGLEHG